MSTIGVEISKQLAEQKNKDQLALQALRMEGIRKNDAERMDELSEQVATLAEAMAAMTKGSKDHAREMGRRLKSLTAETESALYQTKRVAGEMEAASRGISWKMGSGCFSSGLSRHQQP